jgi:hypothetical protein
MTRGLHLDLAASLGDGAGILFRQRLALEPQRALQRLTFAALPFSGIRTPQKIGTSALIKTRQSDDWKSDSARAEIFTLNTWMMKPSKPQPDPRG